MFIWIIFPLQFKIFLGYFVLNESKNRIPIFKIYTFIRNIRKIKSFKRFPSCSNKQYRYWILLLKSFQCLIFSHKVVKRQEWKFLNSRYTFLYIASRIFFFKDSFLSKRVIEIFGFPLKIYPFFIFFIIKDNHWIILICYLLLVLNYK